MKWMTGACCALLMMVVGPVARADQDVEVAAFEALCARVQQQPGQISEDELVGMFETGAQLGRPYAAFLAARQYLARQARPGVRVVRYAVENAIAAGEIHTAVARSKAFLQQAEPSEETARIAGLLFAAQVNLLADTADAYRTMQTFGDTFRQHPSARRFDVWYLNQARSQRDYASAAARLERVLAEGLPPAVEQTFFHSALGWLLDELRWPAGDAARHQAVSPMRRLTGHIRGDAALRAEAAFITENLAFDAARSGKDAEQLERDYQAAITAARTFFDAAPGADTLIRILDVFYDGDPNRGYAIAPAAKRAFFVAQFPRLDDAGRARVLAHRFNNRDLNSFIATPRDWAALGRSRPDFFRGEAAYQVPFWTDPEDPAWYRHQAAFLAEIATRDAAVINALAQDSLAASLDHLLDHGSWLLTTGDFWQLAQRQILPAWRGRREGGGATLEEADVRRIMGEFLVRRVPGSLLALHREAARDYLSAAWQALADKADIADHLAALDWVPYRADDREFVLSAVHRAFSEWVDGARRAAADNEEAQQALQARITRIEAAFDAARRRTAPVVDKAPDALARAAVTVLAAIHAEQAEAYREASTALRAALQEVERDRPRLAMEALRMLTDPSGGMRRPDVQLALLRDLLERWDDGGRNAATRHVAGHIVRSGNRWNWNAIPRDDADQARAISRVFADFLLARMDAGSFSPVVLQWMLDTQRGQHWHDQAMNRDVFLRMVETDSLRGSDYRPGGTRMAATAYMWLARHFFGNPDSHDARSAYDSLFLAEAEADGRLDYQYWHLGGQDPNRAIRDLAAGRLTGITGIPRTYGADSLTEDRDTFFRWERRVLTGASEGQRIALLEHVTAQFGAQRLDSHARGHTYFDTDAGTGNAEARARFFEAIARDSARRATLPVPAPAVNLSALRGIRSTDLTDAELDILIGCLAPEAYPRNWERGRGHEQLALYVHDELLRRDRAAAMNGLLATFWAVMRDSGDGGQLTELRNRTQRLQNQGLDNLATASATAALQIMRPSRADEFGSAMLGIQSRSIARIGGLIPVPRSDRRYPVFEAQADFIGGNYDRAWRQYQQHAGLLRETFSELDMAFVTWIINRLAEVDEYGEAERLAQAVIQWMDASGVQVAAEIRLEVLLAHANIQLSREAYPAARALYDQIATAEAFRGLRGAIDARIMIAEVARLTGEHVAATEQLEELARSTDSYTRKQALYHLAKVSFDQDDFQSARQLLRQVFMLDDTHAEARLLEGRVNLAMRRLENVIELEKIGLSAQQQVIVPGRPLRINLEDHTLSVVGDTAAVRIRVWSSAGDEEIITLLPFADSMTRFRGEITTALAPVEQGDGVLQVLGDGFVSYDFAPDFREQHRVPQFEPPVLQVKSPAVLQVSSGRILSEDEQAEHALVSQIEARLRREGRLGATEASPLSMRRQGSQLKPGQTINVRVTDPDRSVSPEPNTVTVRVRATSGDSIDAFELRETGTHTGVFEGAIPSAPAPATAFASDSDEGAEPNYTISAGDYPAWIGQRDNQRPKLFTIDLNDSVFPDMMTVEAGIQGRRLREFFVQTQSGVGNFVTVGSWPRAYPVWDGAPRATVVAVPEAVDERVRTRWSTEHLNQVIEDASLGSRHRTSLEQLSTEWDQSIFGAQQALRIHHDTRRADAWYLVRIDAAFYVPERQVRTFELVPATREGEALYRLAVNGRQVEGEALGGSRRGPPRFHGALSRGMHTISVYVIAAGRAQPRFTVRQDSPEPPYMVNTAAELFDPATFPPAIDLAGMQPAEIVAGEDNGRFEITFQDMRRTRVVRLLIHDFETDAPAIERISLTDVDGDRILPVEADLMALRENMQIEVIPGDVITVSYEDPSYLSERDRVQEAFLTASYHNAEVSAHMVVGYTEDSTGMRVPVHARLLRYKAGDAIDIIVEDPDEDLSEARDTVELTVQTTFGEPLTVLAQETAAHSGVFQARIFPVTNAPQREGEIQVSEADEITVTYLDRENTDPGVPYPRTIALEQVWYQDPELRVYGVSTAPLSDTIVERLRRQFEASSADRALERVPPRRRLTVHRPDAAGTPDEHPEIVIGGPFFVELIWPTIAQSAASRAELFVQTASGREAAGFTPSEETPFDIRVPGTLRLEAGFASPGAGSVLPGYDRYDIAPLGDTETAEEAGRFIVNIANAPGAVPEASFALEQPAGVVRLTTEEEEQTLAVRGTDTVHIGFRYTDSEGRDTWLTRDVALTADAFLDVMDRHYHATLEGRFVGESAYVRVIDALADTSSERDTVTVELDTGGDAPQQLELTETMSHSGIFKAVMRLLHAEESEDESLMPGDVPVHFGDQITLRYATAEPRHVELDTSLAIHKGDDGIVLPFSKHFEDGEIAVRTQLAIAEAHFELAKRYRQLKQDDRTREAISQGRQILEEAMRDFPDTEVRVQGDYLLADLALELAEELEAGSTEHQRRLQEALSRFSAIVAMYPDSGYAPRAQYKKALTLEAMGNFDLASEEYVKLSYRWPEHELIAETIARLGQYFFRRGREMNEQAEAQTDPVEQERQLLQAREMFTTAAQVFGRLAPRFPNHQLAHQTNVLAGQCYIRAERFSDAAGMLLRVINSETANRDLRAESMYWCADAYMKDGDLRNAYRMFTRLTWDHPESNWARFARGQLATDRFERVRD